ncbi:MAPEG family protein [Oxalicibacterium faecigallinarum]|uniref:Membrane protein n=1 Tax=Oxalicibacterium faecigallinarum TaxID=573741 RepID=A0A8J3AQX5_9BURK|nr:MAPEG family protein [Oxalicibacterium faecigallinarum]GGI18758.1 membrane protein [Oxalicibacterium faecigallinarum]
MHIAYWCILIAGVLPVVTVGIAKAGVKNFDNHNPRQWLDRQDGYRRRADAAHRNHFEAFPFFAAGVLVAQQLGAPQDSIDMLAMAFIAARLAYTFLYLSDRATLRSVAWAIGYLSAIALFLLAAFKGI